MPQTLSFLTFLQVRWVISLCRPVNCILLRLAQRGLMPAQVAACEWSLFVDLKVRKVMGSSLNLPKVCSRSFWISHRSMTCWRELRRQLHYSCHAQKFEEHVSFLVPVVLFSTSNQEIHRYSVYLCIARSGPNLFVNNSGPFREYGTLPEPDNHNFILDFRCLCKLGRLAQLAARTAGRLKSSMAEICIW